jgi:hypothetical protein
MKNNLVALENCEVWEVDDILCTRFTGDYTLRLAEQLQVRTNAMAARHGYRLLMLDLVHLGANTPAARRYLAEDQKRERKKSSVAIVEASFAIRTGVTMLIRAVSVLTNIPVALEFFQDEEHALAWLREERNRLRALPATGTA